MANMRALILSDIHSNIDALEAVLAAAPAHDVVWNLGDVVGYNAAPLPVMARVREMGGLLVRGNHDRACCGLDDAANFNSIALAAVLWTARQLDAEATRWLKEMPCGPVFYRSSGVEQKQDGHIQEETAGPSTALRSGRDDNSFARALHEEGQVRCVHGSLRDEDEYLLSVREAEEQPAAAGSITFFGHTHVQGGFAATADGDWSVLRPAYTEDEGADSYALDLRTSGTYLINPGAVGQPRDRDWRAAFALYDDEAARVTYYRVPYDVRMAQMRIVRAGLPDALGARLRLGR